MSTQNKEADLVTIRGYDDCVIGVCNRIHQETVIAYDMEKFVDRTMELQGICKNAAMEYIEQVILTEWSGEATPCFISVTTLAAVKEFYDEVSNPSGGVH